MTFLEIALAHIARGHRVHPLTPKTKVPLTPHGWIDASGDEGQVSEWWTKWPDANVGIACGPSGLCVLDCDHGLNSAEEFFAWRDECGLPPTLTIRTGRRDSFGVQMYYAGAIPTTTWDNLHGCSGDIKSLGGYVLAAGSIHPVTGEQYTVLCDVPIVPTPDSVRALRSSKLTTGEPDAPIIENRNVALTSIAGKLRNAGLSHAALEAALLQVNEDRCEPPMDTEEVKGIAEHVSKYPLPEPVGEIVFGKPDAPVVLKDWRERYHTFDEMNNAPKPTFLIEGFLQKDVITAVAAPVGQRKTIVACNAVRSLLTGEPLFDHFAVTQQPTRVLYLCPEMGLLSFADRMRNLGLLPYVGKQLFCRTMNSEGHVALTDLTPEELAGAVVVIDTAVRFVIGDENSSEDMKVFAENCFRLMKSGASSVVVLFHSPKGTKEASELTLENAMRGSGDLGAFVSSCWATRLQDPDNDEWKSPSYMKNVKQRDFKSKPFEVTSDELGRLHIVAPPSAAVTLTGKTKGAKGNTDGREDEALQVIRDNPTLSHPKIVLKLHDLGIERSRSWVGNKRFDLLKVGVKTATTL